MRRIIVSALCLVLLILVPLNAQNSKKSYTILVSLDGFRWDYPMMYNTPNLDRMAHEGVKAVMLPSYPASTFPNHYTIATGLVPDHNGIINNTFWDTRYNRQYSMGDSATRYNPQYYSGEPIWVTAQKQGIKTGNMYWVGSDIAIKNTYPTYYRKWSEKPFLTFEQRIDSVLSWLKKPEEERPRLVMLYFEEPDGSGHHNGPRSKETGIVVERMDKLIGVLLAKLWNLPFAKDINLIVTSDHGMTEISKDRVVDMNRYLKSEWYEVIDGRTPTSIFSKKGYRDSIYNALKDVDHIRVWKKEEIPVELNYGSSDRIGDIVVAPELGWQFTDVARSHKGAHGYFPQYSDMQVIFRAIGPDFKKGYTSKGFVNVDIYPLLAYLLQIVPEKTDGNFKRIKDILK
ncbi:ectonucleotide pyrophosphatase/phosphodiesterase [Bacteroides helcogenes]|uniref:Sphingomyelin phosphodiesterase n=1 Tax=Bacteroides helcogenes (strain ATCC 35417 / DSM 20613 / JCM 6297 / CCUG 15421 / P 36-108) TaxID=693979 RepID=E6SU48_BACT6|nr:ectonucleotide pyrophosphatase/phosphodiesterase [Bacteroides helcogenes]ADV44321.1 Sphingomyelin phosphodiesterase [Bacteroides helcogenes P 36-108]MDY5238269.1 ectonucleotide pyrophosphatase/phosphodiesterase [Bacteroides helcogenes]